jgi:hypothetical protein
VVKVDLATMQQVGPTLILDTDDNLLRSAVSDGTHAYFGTDTSPGRVVKVAGLEEEAADEAEEAEEAEEDSAPGTVLPLSVSCAPLPMAVGESVTCTVTGGEAGVEILWRAAYNPVFAGEGVTLDATGSATFSFTVPTAALGQVVTVELVDWLAPVSLGVAANLAPTSVPAGEGSVPATMWSLVMLALAGGLVLRRMSAVAVRG